MGNFSTINVAMKCTACSWQGVTDVQFKYGNLWTHEYGLGSALVWGSTQVGDPEEKRVAVDGIAECPKCKTYSYFDIIIDSGIIESIGRRSGKYDYFHGEGEYVILDNCE